MGRPCAGLQRLRLVPNRISFCLTDLIPTTADILGIKLPANSSEDSVSFLPARDGAVKGPLREAVVHHAINGSFAIRQWNWNLALCKDSDGWSDPRPANAGNDLPAVKLFDLSRDVNERTNL